MTKNSHQFIVHDKLDVLAGRTHRNITARIRAVRAQSSYFGQVEHPAQYAKGSVHLGLLVGRVFIKSATPGHFTSCTLIQK
ncbi:hypothetical protein [Pectobacterium odoriferum]|uniref:hypothetical protein n=1 Tax=Pectobacterium odoriferum TaxID=78398 RepID=UPI0015E1B27D